MSRGVPVTRQQWEQIKQLWASDLFSAEQIHQMTGLSKGYIWKVRKHPTWEEHNACELAASKLAAKRRVEKEKDAKEAYEEAVNEINKTNEINKNLDDPSLKMDIIIEKLDKLIAIVTDIRVNQGVPIPGPEPLLRNRDKAPF